MLIEFNKNNELVNSELSFGNFLVENNTLSIYCDLALDLNKNPKIKEFLEGLITDITVEELELNLPGGFFLIIYSKISANIRCIRDTAGLKTGYYCINENRVYVGSNCHTVAQSAGVRSLNKSVTDLLLANEFIVDGYTFYNDVFEFAKGTKSILSKKKGFDVLHKNNLNLATEDNTLSFNENKEKLRTEILDAHKKLVGSSNIVYLSGGIDSCVMLAALDEVADKSSIHNISYKVKGTKEDETYYAIKAAAYLGYDCEVKEIDPNSDDIIENLTDQILEMNNPYYGLLIFMPEKTNISPHYFGGQDTRLHTPDVNIVDNYAFNQIIKGNLGKNKRNIVDQLISTSYGLNFPFSSNKIVKNLDRIGSVISPDTYLHYFYLKANKHKAESYGLKNMDYSLWDQYYSMDLNNTKTKRGLFNKVIEKKWGEQYTDDIRYMREMASSQGGYMQLPFYDISLARFSSSIPFEQSIKFTTGKDKFSNDKVKVNKVMLREAFHDKLSPEVIYRKKAVSLTVFLMFNGALGELIKDVIYKDLKSSDSFIEEYGYNELLEKYINSSNWEIADQSYLIKVYYLFILILLRNRL